MTTFNGKDGVWRTVGGRHIFIANGQSLKDAMKASGKFKNLKKDKESDKSDEKNDKIDIPGFKDYEYNTKTGEVKVKDDVLKKSNKEADRQNEIDRIAGDDAFLQKKGRELGLNEFKRYMEGKPEDFIKRKDNKTTTSNDNNTSSFIMVNGSGKTVTVSKSDDGKWIDSDGNKYMGYLSKSDVKCYFKGDWKEVKDNDDSLSKQLNKTMDNKTQIAKALGLKADESWKSTKQLYREQKGIDLVEKAINSGKAADYLKLRDRVDSKLQEDMFNYERNFNNMNSIKNYAKVYDLDPHALYYTTNIASNADIDALRKAAELQKSIGMSQSQLKQMYIKQGYSDETAAKMAKEDISERE